MVGHLIGVRDDLQPLDYAGSAAVWELIKHCEYDESDAGKHLTEHALAVMRELIPGRFLDSIPAAGIHFLLGKDTAKMLGVKNTWAYAVFPPMEWTGHVMSRFERDSLFGRKATEWMGRRFFQAFIDETWRGRTRVRNFEVPSQLERRLGLVTD